MCGIAGLIGPEASAQAARALIAPLAHRGPDGLRVEAEPGVALAHARLSIIDLDGGWQPLSAAGSTVIGNGEIYNYKELIEAFDLEARLHTQSDFEPLLHLYAREGEAAFRRLRGMYAFCLIGCDGRRWLVRDPFGIKPLYVDDRGPTLRFASEPRALGGLDAAGAGARLDQLLTLNYVVEEPPGASPRRLAPGQVAQVEDGRLVALRREPALPARGPAYADTRDGLIDQLDAVLEDSVRLHQRSDVPYGLFLSGGVDSTAIATLMARLNARPVTAFTCGFDAPEANDERRGAERVAKALGLDWRETTFGAEDFWRIAPLIAQALDDPTTDYACLPTYRLGEAARGVVKVVLSGEGGDELFAGYGRYRRAERPRWRGGRPAEPQIDAAFLKDRGEGVLATWRSKAQAGAITEPGTRLQRAQASDIATWLPDDLLLKLDRCLMAHGLEGRTPFLDREVAAFAYHLPDAMKLGRGRGKRLLRLWLARACPAARPWARKRGFTVPVARWIAPRAADIGPRVAACEGIAAVCDVDQIRAAFTDPAGAAHRWPLIFTALWWSIHIGGATPEQAADVVFGSA